jgi:Uma2 family endonuclease
VGLVFVVGKGPLMIFEKLSPATKIKKYIRKKAIKNVEERIIYQQKQISAFTIKELRKLILSEEKKFLQGVGWKGAVVAMGAMFGITNF